MWSVIFEGCVASHGLNAGLAAFDFHVKDSKGSCRAVAIALACAPACLRVKELGFPGDFDYS